jgi:hypothetical protein
MEIEENKCLDELRSQSERTGKSRSPDLDVFGWDDSQNNFLAFNKFPSQKMKRTKTPGFKKIVQDYKKLPTFPHLSYRQNSTKMKSFKVFQDSEFFTHPVSQKRKEKIEKSFKVFNTSTKTEEIFKKKHLIIQNVLPDQCRISGSFPTRFSFLKQTVKINSKKYFVIDTCL